jgi:uncharacterized protein DUF3455
VWTRLQFRGAVSKENDMNHDNTTKQQITRAVTRIWCIAVLGMAFTFALPSTAHAQIVIPPVPPGLEVPAGNTAFLLGHGVGTQNYECQPAPASPIGRVAWTLFTPQATLFNDQGEQIITHFASPNPAEGGIVRVTWQDSQDTSSVWARATAMATVDPNSIPEVRLEVVGRHVGPNGGDTLFGTTFIQRLVTQGGLAPSTGCDQLPDVGHKAFIPYTAEYVFYREN